MSGSQFPGPGFLDPGVSTAVREAVPPWLVPAFVAITFLGNAGFYLAAFSLDYWFGDHERGAHALGVALGGMALVVALKALFAEPRPPEAGRLVEATGYSFPSGHATGAAVAYGVLAFDLRMGSRRTRFAVAGVLVALIALSRVVLGVHFVRDVVAGVVAGGVFLAVAIVVTEHAPRPGFFLAVGVGLVAAVLSGASTDGDGGDPGGAAGRGTDRLKRCRFGSGSAVLRRRLRGASRFGGPLAFPNLGLPDDRPLAVGGVLVGGVQQVRHAHRPPDGEDGEREVDARAAELPPDERHSLRRVLLDAPARLDHPGDLAAVGFVPCHV